MRSNEPANVVVPPGEERGAAGGLDALGVRERLIHSRTQIVNAIRAYAAEFGLTAPTRLPQFAGLLEHIRTDDSILALARELFIVQATEFAQLQARIGEIDEKLRV